MMTDMSLHQSHAACWISYPVTYLEAEEFVEQIVLHGHQTPRLKTLSQRFILPAEACTPKKSGKHVVGPESPITGKGIQLCNKITDPMLRGWIYEHLAT